MTRAIIFDFDGVIVESLDIKTKAFCKLFESEGKDVTRKVKEYHLNNAGVSRFDKFRHIYANILKRTLTDRQFKSLCRDFSYLVVDSVVCAPYVKGAYNFLKNYSSVYKFFLSSATPHQEIKMIIKQRGINAYFNAVFGAPNTKPDIVRQILVKHKLLPGEVIYVGDALSDYKAAVGNSVNFIARIKNNEKLFADIHCQKICDLSNLKQSVDILNRNNEND